MVTDAICTCLSGVGGPTSSLTVLAGEATMFLSVHFDPVSTQVCCGKVIRFGESMAGEVLER